MCTNNQQVYMSRSPPPQPSTYITDDNPCVLPTHRLRITRASRLPPCKVMNLTFDLTVIFMQYLNIDGIVNITIVYV